LAEDLGEAAVEGAAGEDGISPGLPGFFEQFGLHVGPEGERGDAAMRVESRLVWRAAAEEGEQREGEVRGIQVYDEPPNVGIGESCPEHVGRTYRPAGDGKGIGGGLDPRCPEEIRRSVKYHWFSTTGREGLLGDARAASRVSRASSKDNPGRFAAAIMMYRVALARRRSATLAVQVQVCRFAGSHQT
jgi:hypothetical protein